jgi:hypothetical protein
MELEHGFIDGTFGLFVAGRATYEYAGLTRAQLEALRVLARAHGASVVPGGDLVPGYSDEDPIYMRLAIGVKVAIASADDGAPTGPFTPAALCSLTARAAEIDPTLWTKAAEIVEQNVLIHPAAVMRQATAADPMFLDGIALDAGELRVGPDRLLLVSAGHLPAVDLVWGVPERRPDDPDDGDEDELETGTENDGVFYGQNTRQEVHRHGVRGQRIAQANFAGNGVVAIDTERITPGQGSYFLVPYYD